ncbi:MAG: beta-lactamase family protein [Bacteroidales bacterium]|nr:beta-lactamase family protein [Bacteroidales bacterium]
MKKKNDFQKKNLLNWLTISLILFCLFSCIKDKNPISQVRNYQYEIPEQTDDGWETASLASVGMNETPLLNLLDELNEIDEHNIHSLIIIKNGKLVFEEYFPGDKFNLAQYTGETGFDRDDTHNLCSATKSFTSALIGIAIDNGYIQSVNQKVFDFFPEYSYILNSTPEKGDLSIEHLLTMRSGIEWDDETYSYYDPRNDMYQLFRSSNPVRYILLKPLIETPGTFFAYRNCNTNLLGAIIGKASGERLDVFSENFVFSKLGITDFEWQMINSNVVFCSGDLRLRPRDMAKFGYLFLNGGVWQGEQIISQNWIDISTAKYSILSNYWSDLDGYGYQWWIWDNVNGVEFKAYAASGWGGQWIIVSPNSNMVFVTTGGNYYTGEQIPIQSILSDYIIPALK